MHSTPHDTQLQIDLKAKYEIYPAIRKPAHLKDLPPLATPGLKFW